MNGRAFGSSIHRLEDPDLLAGRGRYVDDIRLPQMLHAAFVRSPHGHAAIRGIDASAAAALPGVHAVIAHVDIAPLLAMERLVVGLPSKSYRLDLNRPALAIDEVVHVGEPVAIVIADDRYVAEDAAALVEVDYDPLPAISDCLAALAEGAPSAHRSAPHNLLAAFDLSYGDVGAAFARAAHVFAETFWLHRGGGHSMECRGTVASYDAGADVLTVHSSTQMPHALQRVICDMLGRDENQVRVVTPDVGGGFGPKLVSYPEEVALAAAALLVRRPVKWIEDRREHFVASTQERDQHWEMEIAVDADARVLGIRGSLIHDHGAYTARGVNLPYNAAECVPTAYVVPAMHIDVKLAVTNKVPVTPVRGAGHPQGTFAMERLLDRVARELDLDRAEVRRRNLVPAEKMPYTTPLKTRGGMVVVLDSGDYPQCQADALDRIGWEAFPARQAQARREGRYLGMGLANYVKGTGRGPFESATVRIGPSGRVHVYTGAAAMGQSTKTMLAQVVAEQLGGDVANVTVTAGDTAAVSMGIGGSNSRQTVMAGTSAHVAAVKVRDKALKVASHLLEAAEQDLEIVGAEVRVKGVPGMKVGLGQIARALAGTAGYALPGGVTPGMEATEHTVIDDMAYACGCAAVEVEVDVETGLVKVRRCVFVQDSGRVINPRIVEGQIVGGVAHGIGNALFEWMGYDENAQPVTTNLGEYLLVSAPEMPRVEVLLRESPSPLNPIGVKGVGECGVIPMPAAVIGAIEHALAPFGARIRHAPVTPAQVLAAIRAGRDAGGGSA